jgi:hypothetical protein
MATAGYDPRAALDLWELMACVEADAAAAGKAVSVENKFAMLRTHPTSVERQIALEKDMPGAMRLWREHLPKRPKTVPHERPKPVEEEAKEVVAVAPAA